MSETAKFNRASLPGEDTAAWTQRFYALLAGTGRVFRTSDGNLLVRDSWGNPKRVISQDEFIGVLGSIVNFVDVKTGREGAELCTRAELRRTEIATLFHADARLSLPLVVAIVYDPVVYRNEAGGYSISNPGFNPDSGIYYAATSGPPIVPLPGTTHLSTCFSGVPFDAPHSRNALLAWLLSGVVLDPTLDPPLLVVSGNRQGIGKSSVVQAAGHILTGSVPSPVAPAPSEFVKALSAQFLQGDSRVIFIDNIVSKGGSYDNTALATLLTQGFSKSVRLLGYSRNVSCSGVLVAASLNDARLSTDLASRSISVRLANWESSLMVPYCRDYAAKHRRELYGELLWLALQGQDDAESSTTYISCRFRRWVNFVRPRIESHFGALQLEDASSALDEATQELFAIACDSADDGTSWNARNLEGWTVTDLINYVKSNSERFSSLYAKIVFYSSLPAIRSAFGKMLAAKTDQRIGTDPDLSFFLRCVKKKDGPTYHFERITV